ncbi:hypothetical protein FIU88_02890 [Halomonas sp. THAF12]|nr:hypothetical protein FIU88_02890 [Halomonas sp. THAF12]
MRSWVNKAFGEISPVNADFTAAIAAPEPPGRHRAPAPMRGHRLPAGAKPIRSPAPRFYLSEWFDE